MSSSSLGKCAFVRLCHLPGRLEEAAQAQRKHSAPSAAAPRSPGDTGAPSAWHRFGHGSCLSIHLFTSLTLPELAHTPGHLAECQLYWFFQCHLLSWTKLPPITWGSPKPQERPRMGLETRAMKCEEPKGRPLGSVPIQSDGRP